MRNQNTIGIWTLAVDTLDEARVAPWRAQLDAAERTQSARFVMPRHRVQYVAAHTLARAALSTAVATPPSAWQFAYEHAGAKPVAHLAGAPAPVSFSLSHSEGLVGVAVCPGAGILLGFDIEALTRTGAEEVARYFHPAESAWLLSLPPTKRSAGLLRLWTLKEAFIKATGDGLKQDLAEFWFDGARPFIRFAPALAQAPADWHFEQRMIGERHVAACGVRHVGMGLPMRWAEVDPDRFDPCVPLPVWPC
jgi:4'-phosphopantetheinyl transferase